MCCKIMQIKCPSFQLPLTTITIPVTVIDIFKQNITKQLLIILKCSLPVASKFSKVHCTMMNHNCRTSPECGVNSSYWAQLRPTKDNGMNRCNRCPLLQHRECVKACNQRPTTALSTGSCLKDNSCCKSFCKSPRPWTSSCHRLKKQIDQFHHNTKGFL